MKIMGVLLFIVTAFFFMSFCRAFGNGLANDCSIQDESSSCGDNAWCSVNDHVAVCTCPSELTGDPPTICVEEKYNYGSCTANNHCTDLEKCEKNKCIDVCESFVCGKNAWCDAQGHSPVCACLHRYNGDPNIECVEQECIKSGDCDEFDECKNNKCVDACEFMSCGENAWCDVRNHVAFCTCMDRHRGDPITGCIRENCTNNNNCFDFETCKNHNCMDACEAFSCGMNAHCDVRDHEALCICPMGETGDPHAKCLGMSCTTNDDCDEFQECKDMKCIPTSTPLKFR